MRNTLKLRIVRGGKRKTALAVIAAAALLAGLAMTLAEVLKPSSVILSAKIDPAEKGVPIPPSFLGISTDWNSITSRTGDKTTGPSPVYKQLIASLAAYGGGVPTLRVGGNYSDMAFWDPSGIPPRQGRSALSVAITPQILDALRTTERLTSQRIIFGLNLATNDPSLAAAETRAILSYIPRKSILAFAIGNEPEEYPQFHYRPRTYTGEQYLRDWERLARVVRAIDPSLPLAGTDGSGAIMSAGEFLARAQPRPAIYTQHHYAASACDRAGRPYPPGSRNYTSLAKLLSPKGSLAYIDAEIQAASAANRFGIPLYIDEMNSLACYSDARVTNSFGAALWLIKQLFVDVGIGVRGVDLHVDSTTETIFTAISNGRRWTAYVLPLYYAMLAFAQAAGHNGHLLYSSFTTAKVAKGGNAAVFPVRQPDGSYRVLVLNLSLGDGGTVRITLPHATRAASLIRLMAPRPSSSFGITFAGQSVPVPTSNGKLKGSYRATSIRPDQGVYAFDMPRASAATLIIPP